MKTMGKGIVHLLAAMFLFTLMGAAFSILMIQNTWLDMRFDSEFMITVSTLTGLWFFFVRMFMNGKNFGVWERRGLSLLLTGLSFVIIIGITLTEGSISILPAYMVRKALFLENILTLSNMNGVLIVTILLGFLSLNLSHRNPLLLESGTRMEWDRLNKSSRIGMISLFGILGLFSLIYLGQGQIHYSINHSVVYLKNADVEGFREYLLSFGPLAAVISGLMMIFQSVIAPLPAFVITFANGNLFGWFYGALLSWSSAMLGAILCFYLAKFLGRPVVEKIITRTALEWWDQFFAKYGKHSVFIARLVPIVSFDLVSYAAGITSISFWEFFWATGLGQLPATILYSYLGQSATDFVKILFFLFTIVIALVVLGMILRPRFSKQTKSRN